MLHDCSVIGYCLFSNDFLDEGEEIEAKVIYSEDKRKWYLHTFDDRVKDLHAGRWVPINCCPFCGEKLKI